MNVVCIAGNLTKTPELRTTQSNKKVTSFTIAVNEGKNKTEFVNCQAWEKTAELICEYSKKGDRLAVSGRLSSTKYTDKDGVEKYKTEVVVSQFDMPPKRSTENLDAGPKTAAGAASGGGIEENEIPF